MRARDFERLVCCCLMLVLLVRSLARQGLDTTHENSFHVWTFPIWNTGNRRSRRRANEEKKKAPKRPAMHVGCRILVFALLIFPFSLLLNPLPTNPIVPQQTNKQNTTRMANNTNGAWFICLDLAERLCWLDNLN